MSALVLVTASLPCAAASSAAISGTVRDAQGVVQMGVIVQVLSAGSVSVASAFTDMHGRYRIADLLPGSYQVRASSALLIAATRRNLRLSNGMLATVNLTVAMLSDPISWLPAERRKPSESGDDWTWTLRSAASRPILRMLGDGEIVPAEAQRSTVHVHASTQDHTGVFAADGPHTALALDRRNSDGTDAILTADTGTATFSTYIAAGYERTSAFAGSYRMVVSYASHPEIAAGSSSGMQVMRIASAKRMQLGDAVDVEAGGTIYAIHTGDANPGSGTALATDPFVQVTVHPGEVWAVRYTLATSPEVQDFDGVNSIQADLPVAAMRNGRLTTESGHHQEIAVNRKFGNGAFDAAIFRDAIDRSVLAGVNGNAADFAGTPGAVLLDTQNGAFRFLGAGYTATGARLAWSMPITSGLSANFACEHGAALAARSGDALPHTETADSFTASIKGRIFRTGTKLRAAYRWQPEHLVTAVDTYDAPSRQGYLGFYIRQAVSWGNHLPPGLEATVDVTNLLEQGYQPFLSADGRTLFLAESPRTVQGGLSFTF